MKAVRPRASIQSKGQGALGRLGFFADAACGLFGSEASIWAFRAGKME